MKKVTNTLSSPKIDMKRKTKFYVGLISLFFSFLILLIVALDLMGIGPNLGLPFGYYGKFNRVIARVEDNPNHKIIRTTLHRDIELEDFYITVQMQDEREVRLRFEGADTRSLSELFQELEKVGM
jgi:hypothetical protein